MLVQIPEELFCAEHVALDVSYHYSSSQFPQMLYMQTGCIGLDLQINMEIIVITLH